MSNKESSRKYVHISRSAHDTTNVVSYDFANSRLNNFLWVFDVWDSSGHFSLCSDNKSKKISFECSSEFYDLASTDTFIQAFKRMGVEVLIDDDPKVLELD